MASRDCCHVRPFALLAFLVLLLPLADARHAPPPDPHELVAQKAPLSLHLEHDGTAKAAYRIADATESRSERHDFSWDYDFHWEGYVDLAWDNVSRQYQGLAALEVRARANLLARSHWEHLLEGETVAVEDQTESCVLDATWKSPGPGEFPGRAPRWLTATGEMKDERTLRLTILMLGMPHQPGDWSDCSRETVTTDQDGTRTQRSRSYPPSPAATVLLEEALAEGQGMPMSFVVDLDVDQGKSVLRRSGTAPLMPDDHEAPGRFMCPEPSQAYPEDATCSWSGELVARIAPIPCDWLRGSYREHLEAVEQWQRPPPDAPEAWVRAWGEEGAKRVEDALRDARALAIMCDESDDALLDTTVLDLLVAYRDALERILREKGLSQDGFAELVGTERRIQLLGGDAHRSFGDLRYDPASGTVRVKVHSPVALHAWTPDGRHVGWNATRGAPDVEVEGASYEGRPGEAQVLTLPAGTYKVQVDEQADARYLLETEWEARDGSSGNESFFASGRRGETTSLYYALGASEAAAPVRFDALPVRRSETPDGFRFIDAPLAGKAGAPDAPPAGGADVGPAGRAGAPDGGAARSGGPGATRDEADPTPHATPGGPFAWAVAALALASTVRRRR